MAHYKPSRYPIGMPPLNEIPDDKEAIDVSILESRRHFNRLENLTKPPTLKVQSTAELPKLSKGRMGVWRNGRICDLTGLSNKTLENLSDFIIDHEYGTVLWKEPVNVKRANMDEIVRFAKEQVDVYPDQPDRPAHGTGFNKRMQITIKNVWPKKGRDEARLSKKRRKLEEFTVDRGYKFIDYKNGEYTFEVDDLRSN
uniref:Peptidase S59 domain-containing protein n=1 Tax=Lotharella oceanica TaxID=641309 RepID=A0A7S2TVQ4_9EUKA|mmetsp:Transcript_32048/g.59666  ORF Transcript_32048/g.59666 Transcript_32048/m.59666 type:complete len:198 (+) Transcript_32048:179-772(+)